jgi:hypothetical protein
MMVVLVATPTWGPMPITKSRAHRILRSVSRRYLTFDVVDPNGQLIGYPNPPSLCTAGSNPGHVQVTVGLGGITSDGAKAFLATVIAAKVAGRQVRAWADLTGGSAQYVLPDGTRSYLSFRRAGGNAAGRP